MDRITITTFEQFRSLPNDDQREMIKILTAVVIARGAKDVSDVDVRCYAPNFDYTVFDRYMVNNSMAEQLCTMIATRLFDAVDATANDIFNTITGDV